MSDSSLAIVIIGHGSRRGAANERFRKTVSLFAQRRPETPVSVGFIELAEPGIDKALDDACATTNHVILLPLMLFTAGHVKNDIPLAIESACKRHPHVRFDCLDVIGADPDMATLIHKKLETLEPGYANKASDYAVMVVGRGSSDPSANGDFHKLVRLYEENRGLAAVFPTFIGITTPRVPQTLDLIARIKPKKLLVIPYMLYPGLLCERLEQQVADFAKRYTWVQCSVADPIGDDDVLFDHLSRRIDEHLSGQTPPLACVSCQYRVPLKGLEENVGGLKSLMWSVRHRFTHSQASQEEHTHKPLKKHVFVCGNIDCVDRGAIPLIESLRREIKTLDDPRAYSVTKTSCMGRCGDGPNVVVYPDGIWYREMTKEDTTDLVGNHLANDQLVDRRVDTIM